MSDSQRGGEGERSLQGAGPEQRGEESTQSMALPAETTGREEATALRGTASRPPPPPALSGWLAQGEALAPGRVVAGRYTVLELLGQGGMGVVLSAYDARLDRRVALKLCQQQKEGSGDGEALGARMVREAQAMARLSHPNVVTVYDAGTLEDGSLYIAMEQVEGQTLSVWCRQNPRPWQEVLAAYVAAGRGLAAAHEAGLVHRDFKPENVLVGKDGRVRVTDFGVARATAALTPTSASTPEAAAQLASSWETPLTMPGAVVGTPRYLAPELLKGQAASERSDMFAYCVALYEALYGQPAFAGESRTERLRAQLEGKVCALPAQTQVPAWVGRVVLQGLTPQPQQRPASMEALLEALGNDPEVRRRERLRVAAVGALVVALGSAAAAGWLRQREQGPRCEAMAQRLAGVWGEEEQARMRQAFLATGLAYAEDTWQRTASALSAYAGEWVRRRQAVCEASSQGNASGLVAQEEACLERRRSQLKALTAVLTQAPDKALVPKAVQAVAMLESLEACSDAQELAAEVAPPQDATLRARVEYLQEEVDRLKALREAGQYQQGLQRGEQLLRELETVGWEPLTARVLLLMAQLQGALGDYAGAEARLRRMMPLAARARQDALVALGWSELIHVLSAKQARHEEALKLELTLETAVERTANDKVRAHALVNLGQLLRGLGRYEEAKARSERSLELRQKVFGPEHLEVSNSHSALANILFRMGRTEEAKAHWERALALEEKVLGPEHPNVVGLLNNLGVVSYRMGRNEEARGLHERALAIREKVLGPEHPEVATSLNNLGNVLWDMDLRQEALALHTRALAIREKTLGPEHPEVALSLNNLGSMLQSLGRHQEAMARFEQALAFHEKVLGPEHPEVALSLNNLGSMLHLLGRHAEARARYARSLAVLEKALGPQNSRLAEPLWGLGELYQRQGQPARALPLLERALALASGTTKADAAFALARALWQAGRERPRAVALASQALEHFQQARAEAKVAELSRWLAEHPLP